MKDLSLEGKSAPKFKLPSTEGTEISLSTYPGKIIVLYFYPKDLTPGCTIQAVDFTDRHREFQKQGAVVLGVSRDPISLHEKFKEKHGLVFPLLSDTEEKAVKAFGVLKVKNMYGKKVLGIERSTFVIDDLGKIRREWRKVKVEGHVDEVLSFVKSLKKKV